MLHNNGSLTNEMKAVAYSETAARKIDALIH